MKSILVLCTGNSCRSQIMHGFLEQNKNLQVKSAGVETHGVNPGAIATMKEVGIDISGHTSNNITEYQGESFDYVITVCDNAREKCPYFPAQVKVLHHNFSDPAKAQGTPEEIRAEFARVRDEIKAYAEKFLKEEGLA